MYLFPTILKPITVAIDEFCRREEERAESIVVVWVPEIVRREIDGGKSLVGGVEENSVAILGLPGALDVCFDCILQPGSDSILGHEIVAAGIASIPVHTDHRHVEIGVGRRHFVEKLIEVAKLAPAVTSGGSPKVEEGNGLAIIAW